MTKNNMIELLENIQKRESGATLHDYTPAHYTSGYQVSKTENGSTNMAADIKTAYAMVESLQGNAGIWYSNGMFYIETSYHIASLDDALAIGREYHQLTIYDWQHDSYINVL